MMKKYNGFTLIELLVVISIIGILAGLVMVSFTASQRQARDTARKSDLRQYQTLLEDYANKNNGLYLSSNNITVQASSDLCTNLGETSCPEDIKNASDGSIYYKYQSDGTAGATATKFVLWAGLENSTDNWVVCSTGKVGAKTQSGFSVVGGTCPL